MVISSHESLQTKTSIIETLYLNFLYHLFMYSHTTLHHHHHSVPWQRKQRSKFSSAKSKNAGMKHRETTRVCQNHTFHFFSKPAKHARRTSQPNSETTTLNTSLSLDGILFFIWFPAPWTTPISIANSLVAEETEPEPARTWKETRIRQVQVFIADGTWRRNRDSAITLVQLRKTKLLP